MFFEQEETSCGENSWGEKSNTNLNFSAQFTGAQHERTRDTGKPRETTPCRSRPHHLARLTLRPSNRE